MATAQDIMTKAMYVMGEGSAMKPIDPSAYQVLFSVLIGMLTRWENLNTALGITIPATYTDELGNPVDTDSAIYYTLSLEGAPLFQKTLSMEARAIQQSLYNAMLTTYNPSPLPQYPSTLPVGQGNRRSGWDMAYYPPPNGVVVDGNGVPILAE